jgi:hypothetical protein
VLDILKKYGVKASDAAFREQVQRTEHIIQEVTGFASALFRPLMA